MSENTQDQNTRYYDLESVVYDQNRYGSVSGRRVEEFHKKVLDILLTTELNTGASVLEMGCGTGRLLHHLASNQFDLYGIDMSPGMLAVAKERLGGAERKISLQESNATETPFEAATFDAIYSILVVNLIPEYEKMFKEAARLIKPGGVFVFNIPNLESVYFLGGLYVNFRGKTVGSNEAGHRYSHWFRSSEWRGALVELRFYG